MKMMDGVVEDEDEGWSDEDLVMKKRVSGRR